MSIDKVSFQNGFLCGMATKGLVRSGEYYKPTCWNDDGVYTYFYIDFHRAIEEFSLGMFLESIIVYDSEEIQVTGVEQVSSTVYKVCADIADRLYGVTVINKKSGLLTSVSGARLPVFSVMFYVEGLDTYARKAYKFETAEYPDNIIAADETIDEFNFWQSVAVGDISETGSCAVTMTASEGTDVSYWEI